MASIDAASITCLIRPPYEIQPTWTRPFMDSEATISNCASACPINKSVIFLAPIFPVGGSQITPTSLSCYCDVSGVQRLVEQIPYFMYSVYCSLPCGSGGGTCGGMPGRFADGTPYASAVVAYSIVSSQTGPLSVASTKRTTTAFLDASVSTSSVSNLGSVTTTGRGAIIVPTAPALTAVSLMPNPSNSKDIDGWTNTSDDIAIIIAAVAFTVILLLLLVWCVVVRIKDKKKVEERNAPIGGGAGVFKEGKERVASLDSKLGVGGSSNNAKEEKKESSKRVVGGGTAALNKQPLEKQQEGRQKAQIPARSVPRLPAHDKHTSLVSLASGYGMTTDQFLEFHKWHSVNHGNNLHDSLYTQERHPRRSSLENEEETDHSRGVVAIQAPTDFSKDSQAAYFATIAYYTQQVSNQPPLEYLKTYDPEGYKYTSMLTEAPSPLDMLLSPDDEVPLAVRDPTRESMIYSAAVKHHIRQQPPIIITRKRSSAVAIPELTPVEEERMSIMAVTPRTSSSEDEENDDNDDEESAYYTPYRANDSPNTAINSTNTGARTSMNLTVSHPMSANQKRLSGRTILLNGDEAEGARSPLSLDPLDYVIRETSLLMTELNSQSPKRMSTTSADFSLDADSEAGSSPRRPSSIWSMTSETSSAVVDFARDQGMLQQQVREMMEEQKRKKKLLEQRSESSMSPSSNLSRPQSHHEGRLSAGGSPRSNRPLSRPETRPSSRSNYPFM